MNKANKVFEVCKMFLTKVTFKMDNLGFSIYYLVHQ